MIPYPYYQNATTVSGVTNTVNPDGSVTLNGTVSESGSLFFLTQTLRTEKGKRYLLTGCPKPDQNKAYQIVASYRKNGSEVITSGVFSDTGDGKIFSFDEDYEYLWIYILSRTAGYTFDNLTFNPMLVDLDAHNLIPYPYARTTQTINGITFTDNGDGTITINGTATAKVWYPISTRSASTIYATSGIYYLSGCPAGGSNNTYFLQCNVYNDAIEVNSFNEYGVGRTQNLSRFEFTTISVNFNVREGVTVENLTFRPLLVNMDDVSGYEPYGYKIPIKNQSDTTNIYTPNQIMQGESATFNEPFKLSKANQLSVETAVKPSAVKYTYYTY